MCVCFFSGAVISSAAPLKPCEVYHICVLALCFMGAMDVFFYRPLMLLLLLLVVRGRVLCALSSVCARLMCGRFIDPSKRYAGIIAIKCEHTHMFIRVYRSVGLKLGSFFENINFKQMVLCNYNEYKTSLKSQYIFSI